MIESSIRDENCAFRTRKFYRVRARLINKTIPRVSAMCVHIRIRTLPFKSLGTSITFVSNMKKLMKNTLYRQTPEKIHQTELYHQIHDDLKILLKLISRLTLNIINKIVFYYPRRMPSIKDNIKINIEY